MTKRQSRKQRQSSAIAKSTEKENLSKPEWADADQVEKSQEEWRKSFLSQFSWYNKKLSKPF